MDWVSHGRLAGGERGQASVLVVGAMLAVLLGAFVLAAVARGGAGQARAQTAADLGALAGARAMLSAYPRLFEPAVTDGRMNPRHLDRGAYLALGRDVARRVAAANGAAETTVAFPDGDSFAPVRIRVTVRSPLLVDLGPRGREVFQARARAEAELAAGGPATTATGGGYDGPLAYRQGKPMRPDVAQAFDRMAAAARADGVALIVVSGYRSDAEQAILFARNPNPKWVARPGTSLHRNATELDLGPRSAYGWLAANARRFGFIQRYAWEAWHYGYVYNARSTWTTSRRQDGERAAMPAFVPARYAAPIARAAQRFNVSAALLAAQLYAESNFNPFARSRAGALGIAQFMPGTARAYGVSNPFDAEQSIDGQARLMRDLLRRFGSVPLALAAYNAGPALVSACMCVPPYPETRGYVARILGLLGGSGDVSAGTLGVRLVA